MLGPGRSHGFEAGEKECGESGRDIFVYQCNYEVVPKRVVYFQCGLV